MNQTIFIADLHLSPETPKLNMKFMQALSTWLGKIDALYILGDLFDAWVGDDNHHFVTDEIIQAMHAFSKTTPIWVMHGNRDFLLGNDFSKRSGAGLLADPSVVDLYGQSYVLSHGDLMCTDDVEYQAFRAQARNPMWQQAILAKPLVERRLLATQIRQMSESKKNSDGLTEISDVTDAGVQALMSDLVQDNAIHLIHGHTHRPNTHIHQVNGINVTRHVIQDWHDDMAGYLALSSDGNITAHTL